MKRDEYRTIQRLYQYARAMEISLGNAVPSDLMKATREIIRRHEPKPLTPPVPKAKKRTKRKQNVATASQQRRNKPKKPIKSKA
jgi:hypothetical protein